jgi:CheY-like chemotaxis protein
VSLSGSVEDLPLLEILQVVSFCQKTGHLTVRAPEGEGGVVFSAGRVVAGYIWDVPPAAPAGTASRDEFLRTRIAGILERLVRLREGEFAFNLTDEVPRRLGARDLSSETLQDGINPEELMLDLARKLDEDRRDTTAVIEASFSASEPADAPAAAAETDDEPGELQLDELQLEEPAPPAPESVSSEEVAPQAAAPAPAEPPTRPAVLLVDDEDDVVRVLATHLSESGFEVRTAGDVDSARRAMLQLAALGRRFLLVADLGLPSASGSSFRGGLDVARQATALTTPPPVLLMVEAMDEKLRARARRLGVSLLAFKPGLSKLDPLQHEADLRAFAGKLAHDLLPRLAGRRGGPEREAGFAAPPDDAGEPLRREALRSALAEMERSADPDLVAFLLLRTARSFFPRVVLFVLKDDALRGLSGFGPVEGAFSLDLLARELSVALDEPSAFAESVATGRAWSGPIPPSGPLRALLDRMGPLGARDAAVLPVRAPRDTVAVLYGDAPHGGPLPDLAPLVAFVDRAGRALEESLAARRGRPGAA